MKRWLLFLLVISIPILVYGETNQPAPDNWVERTYLVPTASELGAGAGADTRYAVKFEDIFKLIEAEDIDGLVPFISNHEQVLAAYKTAPDVIDALDVFFGSTNWRAAVGEGGDTFIESDPFYNAWDKSTGISILMNQVSDLNSTNVADLFTGTGDYLKADGTTGTPEGTGSTGDGDMSTSQYDVNENFIVDAAESLSESGGVNSSSANEVRTHLDNLTLHRTINDTGTSTTDLWSASYINNRLGLHLLASNNLNDLSSNATARTNLGLGNAATRTVGTTSLQVAAGDAPVNAVAEHTTTYDHSLLHEHANSAVLNKIPSDTAATVGQVITKQSDGTLAWGDQAGGTGASTFIGLSDTPANYTGQGGRVVYVNDEGSGLEFRTVSTGGATSFTGLSDTPGDYLGFEGMVTGVTAGGDGLEYISVLKPSNNLSDLDSASTSRSNLGLGNSATLSVGTSAGTVAAGNHLHTGVYQGANIHLDDLADGTLSGDKVGTGIVGDNITTGTVAEDRIASTIARVSELPEVDVDFDPVGTDNSTNVSLAGTYDYLSLAGQEIALGQIDLTTDVTGLLPVANIHDDIARDSELPVATVDFDPVGTDNSTDVTLGTANGLSLSDQELSLAAATNASAGAATAAQITLLESALQSESDPVYSAWDKSTGISITESQISDLGAYLTSADVGAAAYLDATNGVIGDVVVWVDDGAGNAAIPIDAVTAADIGLVDGAISISSIDLPTGADYLVDGVALDVGDLTDTGSLLGGTDDQTASEVNITDAGTYYTGTTVEEALQEIGAGGIGGGGSVAIADITDWPVGVSATEVGYLDGVTSNIQAQLDGISVGSPITTVPTYSDDTCTAGEYAFDATHAYFCRATDTWDRIALAGWSNPAPTPAVLIVTPTSHDFGEVDGTDSQEFVITNTGDEDLVMAATAYELAGDEEFSVTANTCNDATIVTYTDGVAANESCSIEVTFTGTSASGGGVFTDDFNRADEDLDASANWTTYGENGSLEVRSNAVGSGYQSHRYGAYTGALADDQYAQVLFGPTTIGHVGVFCRMDSALNGYTATQAGTGSVRIYRLTDGVTTQLGANGDATSAGGQTIRLECEGTELRVYLDDVLHMTRSDSTYSGGAAGIYNYNSDVSARVDDFEAGNL